jgi:hypothetical protein
MATDKRSPQIQQEQAASQPKAAGGKVGKNVNADREEFRSGGGSTGQSNGDRSIEFQGRSSGTTGPSGTSDAGGGSGTVGGLTGGVGGTALEDDEHIDEQINRERRETPGGKISQRDNNIKVDS